jgi:hypothetical protein
MLAVLIALVLSLVTPTFTGTAYGKVNGHTTAMQANVNLPMISENRYAPEDSTNIVTIITDQLIPIFLPGTSGQGVCNIDVSCDANGNVVK